MLMRPLGPHGHLEMAPQEETLLGLGVCALRAIIFSLFLYLSPSLDPAQPGRREPQRGAGPWAGGWLPHLGPGCPGAWDKDPSVRRGEPSLRWPVPGSSPGPREAGEREEHQPGRCTNLNPAPCKPANATGRGRGWGLKSQPGCGRQAGPVFVNEAWPSFLPASPDHSVTSGEALTKRGTSKSKCESDRSRTDRHSSGVSLRLSAETHPQSWNDRWAPAGTPWPAGHTGVSWSPCTPLGQRRATPHCVSGALDRTRLWRNPEGPPPIHC